MALKRGKMCELINCLLNMVYTTCNNVGSEWQCLLLSLNTTLFRESSKISMNFGQIHHCGAPYSKSHVAFVCAQELQEARVKALYAK